MIKTSFFRHFTGLSLCQCEYEYEDGREYSHNAIGHGGGAVLSSRGGETSFADRAYEFGIGGEYLCSVGVCSAELITSSDGADVSERPERRAGARLRVRPELFVVILTIGGVGAFDDVGVCEALNGERLTL